MATTYNTYHTQFGQRNLGVKGSDVASASTITLGQGNYFRITGTTTIDAVTKEDWTSGTPIWLYFESAVTLTHNASLPVTKYGFYFRSGANYSVSAGQLINFISDDTYLFKTE